MEPTKSRSLLVCPPTHILTFWLAEFYDPAKTTEKVKLAQNIQIVGLATKPVEMFDSEEEDDQIYSL